MPVGLVGQVLCLQRVVAFCSYSLVAAGSDGEREGGDHPTLEAAKALVLGLDGFLFYSAANRIMKFNYSLVNHHLSLASQEEPPPPPPKKNAVSG